MVDASVSGFSRWRLTRLWNRVGEGGGGRCLYWVRVVVLPPWLKDLHQVQLRLRPGGAGHCRPVGWMVEDKAGSGAGP
jgi:hypothetical protein